MLEDGYSQKLKETVSNMAKRFEEEKKDWDEKVAAKDAEMSAIKMELEGRTAQLKAGEDKISDLENQLLKLKDQISASEAENGAVKAEIIEIKRSHRAEIESLEKMRKNDLVKASESFDGDINRIEKLLTEERLKWRDKLRAS